MKRTIALCMIFSILLLTACSKSIYNDSEERQLQSTTYQVPSASSDNDSNQSDSTKSNSYLSVTSGRHNVPKVYDLLEGQGTENDFIKWCKDSINDYSVDNIYTDNSKFLSYIRNNKKIIIPHMNKIEFRFQRATSIADYLGCCYSIWYMKENYQRFRFFMEPIPENFNLYGYFSKTKSVDYEIDRGVCKYGQYFVGILEDDSEKLCSVYFEVEGHVVQLFLDKMEWSPEFFNYFEFETVSLKD